MPGRTHLQHAQPVLLSHHLLAHAWALLRDVDRWQDWDRRTAVLPYGSGALAGSSLGLDPEAVAADLGFTGAVENSIDGTAAVTSPQSSPSSTPWPRWTSPGSPRRSSSGRPRSSRSSRWMTRTPRGRASCRRRRTPTSPSWLGGKAGDGGGPRRPAHHAQGAAIGLQPRSSGGQEPVFDGIDTLEVLLPAFAGMVATMRFNTNGSSHSRRRGSRWPLTLPSGWFARGAVPGRPPGLRCCVRECEARASSCGTCSDDDLAAISADLTPAVRAVLSVRGSLESRGLQGRHGTGAGS